MKEKITEKLFLNKVRLKIPSLMLFLFLFSVTGSFLYGQEGSTCDAPIIIEEMPYEHSADSGDYGVNYSGDDVPEEADGAITEGTGSTGYLDGYDVVYHYMPTEDGEFSLSLSQDDGWAGLYVFSGCPFDSTLAYHTSTSGLTRSISDIPVEAGEIYYIVVSSWNDPSMEYTLNIEGAQVAELEDCEEAIAGEAEDMDVCANVSFSLSTDGVSSLANGLTYQWEESEDGNDWTEIEEATSKNYHVTEGIAEPMNYRLTVTCEFGGTDTSDPIAVSINPANECYCEPGGTNSSYYINDFTTTGGVENIENLDSGYAEGGYGDYTETHTVSQVHTESIDFEATYEGGTYGTKIWVDWNQDGSFDEDEIVHQTSSYSNSESGSITVPESAALGETRMRIGISYTPNSGPNDPCESGSREFEDYTFEVMPLEECEGTPTAGTVESEMTVCANVAFELSSENASQPAAGLDRAWQSSPAGEDDWTDIEESNSSSFILTEGISEPTDFRYTVNCTNSNESDVSETMSVTLNSAEECYCVPEGTNSNRFIDDFITSNGQENISNEGSGFSENGHGEFMEMKVSQLPGNEVSFEAEVKNSSAGFRIWVDWNQDGSFDEIEEVAYASSGYSTSHSGSFTIPENATSGETRMRIVSHYLSNSGSIDPCETDFSYGEFEDYTFEVIPLEDCTGTPDAGIAMDDFSICDEIGFEITVEESSEIAGGLERVWQSSLAGEDDWTDIEGANLPYYFVEDGITADMEYRFKVHCDFSDETDYSDIIEVSLKPDTECYCIPTGSSNNADEIANFTLENLDNDSTQDDGVDGYSDFSHLPPAELIPGLEYVAELTSGTGSGNHGAAIWIDFDQSGEFDEDEMVAHIESEISSSETVEFPAFAVNAAPGTYSLRVQYHYNKDGEELDPCETTSSYSETEDYMIEVLEVDCFPPHNIIVDYITDNSADVSWDTEEDNASWVVYYGEEGFDQENGEGESIEVTDEPSVTLSELDGETTYEVYVKALCADDEESVLVGPTNFTTLPTPPENTRVCDAIALEANTGCIDGTYTNEDAFEESEEPLASCFNDYHGSNSVWFTFEAPANGIAFVSTDFNSTEFNTEIAVFEAPEDCEDLATFGEEVGCATSGEDVELTGLTPGATYYIQVAGFNDTEGEFCIEVEMDDDAPICEAPTDISIDNIDGTEVEISWTDNDAANQWEVLYGETGFDIESEGENTIVDIPETTLTDLEEDTEYEVYVRAICDNLNSDLTGPETFTTEEMSVDSEIFQDFSFYPNPVKDQLTLKAGSQIETVEVYNLLGQSVISAQPNSLEAQINTETLQAGVYLMEVSINGSQKSFRIVKK